MIPARIIGRVVPAHTVSSLNSVRLLLVQPVDDGFRSVGKPVVACDAIGANLGEWVYMAQGGEATLPLPDRFNPSDMTIIAIIDRPSEER